jgi:hypothetical protein
MCSNYARNLVGLRRRTAAFLFGSHKLAAEKDSDTLSAQLPAERAFRRAIQAVKNRQGRVHVLPAANEVPPALQPSTLPFQEPEPEAARPILNLRIAFGPVLPRERTRILAEYCRLTNRRVPIQTFLRCTEQSPEGPAIHGVLESAEGIIVGHCCLVPIRMDVGRHRFRVGKAEYFFVSEDYRNGAIRGFENSDKGAAGILLEQLYQHGTEQGWGPFLASLSSGGKSVHLSAGCHILDFNVMECFFVLNPVRAWHWGWHLPSRQRRMLFLAALAQRTFSSVVLPLTYDPGLVRKPRVGETIPVARSRGDNRLSLAEAEDFLRWRYPDDAYSRFVFADGSPGYAITQKGAHGEYLRVQQSRPPANGHTSPLIWELIRQASWSHALGVRWSVYGKGPEQEHLVSELRKLGFFCVPSIRRVLIYAATSEFLSPEKWNLSDSLFTFEDLYPDSSIS